MSAFESDELTPKQAAMRERNVGRLMIFFIYLIFGPPTGGLLFLLSLMAYGLIEPGPAYDPAPSESSIIDFLWGIPMFVGFVAVFGYFFGGLQAAGTGLLLTFMSKEDGRFGYGLAFLAALVPSFLGAVLFGLDAPGFAVSLFVTGVAASLVLRVLFRKRFRRS